MKMVFSLSSLGRTKDFSVRQPSLGLGEYKVETLESVLSKGVDILPLLLLV